MASRLGTGKSLTFFYSVVEKCASLRYLEDSVFQLGLLDVLAVEGAGALGEVHQLARVITVRWPGLSGFSKRTVQQLAKGTVSRDNLDIPAILRCATVS